MAHRRGGGIAVAAAAATPTPTPALVESLVLVERTACPTTGDRAGSLVSGDFLDRPPSYRQLRTRWQACVGGAAGPSSAWTCPPSTGNSHMPMTDTSSDVVAAMIAEWPGASVPARPHTAPAVPHHHGSPRAPACPGDGRCTRGPDNPGFSALSRIRLVQVNKPGTTSQFV
ncbi:hypothetical protein GCM10009772_14640 [Pseudonocardia alni subsp. carboxydivorans]